MNGVAISGKEIHESEKELTGIYVCIWMTQREEMWVIREETQEGKS